MRCCLLTLGRWHTEQFLVDPGSAPQPGQVLPCNHCNNSMVFIEGAWEWNKGKTDYRLRG